MGWLLLCYSVILLQLDIIPVVIFGEISRCCPCTLFDPPVPPDPPFLPDQSYMYSRSSSSKSSYNRQSYNSPSASDSSECPPCSQSDCPKPRCPQPICPQPICPPPSCPPNYQTSYQQPYYQQNYQQPNYQQQSYQQQNYHQSNCPPANCPPASCPPASCPQPICPQPSCPAPSSPPANYTQANCPPANCPPASCPQPICPPASCPSNPPPECPPANCPSNPPPTCPPASCPPTSCPSNPPPECPPANCSSNPPPNCPPASCPPANCPSNPPPECPPASCTSSPPPNCPPANCPPASCPSNPPSDCPPASCPPASCPSSPPPTCPPASCPSNPPPTPSPKTSTNCPSCPPASCPRNSCSCPSLKTPNIMLSLLLKRVPVTNKTISYATKLDNLLTEHTKTVTTHQTIRHVVLWENHNMTFPDGEKLLEIFKSDQNNADTDKMLISNKPDNSLRNKVLDSITRILNFFNAQIHQTAIPDMALALMFLRGIDEKHGSRFHKQVNLTEWIRDSCERVKNNSYAVSIFCNTISRNWKNRSGEKRNISTIYWKNASVLQNEVNEMDDKLVKNIGNENEEIWSTINIQCFRAVARCELPLLCERIYLDENPRSQYLLTHQVLLRILIDTMDCKFLKPFVTEEKTYGKFCAKMYMEAKYLDVLNNPIVYRDLFAELVGYCGYLGYTNFFRQDWLEDILSWQSKSAIGCFIKDSSFPDDVLTTDEGFRRYASKSEREKDEDFKPEEECLPHLTAVNLVALSTYYDYLMESYDDKS